MKVAVTGGTGRIAGILRARLTDRFAPAWLSQAEGDVTDLAALERALAGMDAVVHLAANADAYASWDELAPVNVGAYHAFEAARWARVRRVVFASSNHAMGMYMRDDDRFADADHPTEVGTDAPVRPDGLYGASKAWGEALGRLYAEQHGLEVVCLRIGWVPDEDEPPSTTEMRREPPEIARRAPGNVAQSPGLRIVDRSIADRRHPLRDRQRRQRQPRPLVQPRRGQRPPRVGAAGRDSVRADRGEAVFVISGPSAAGKSTVARQLASRFARGVHLEGDVSTIHRRRARRSSGGLPAARDHQGRAGA